MNIKMLINAIYNKQKTFKHFSDDNLIQAGGW